MDGVQPKPMSIVLVGDPHFANRTGFAKQPSNPEFQGCNSRLHEIAQAVRRAITFAKDGGAEAVVILGDIFHDRGVIQVPVFNAMYQILNEAKDKGVEVILFPGNHDYVDLHARGSAKLHSILSFEGAATVVHSASQIELDSFICSIVPFTPSAEKTTLAAKKLYEKSKKSSKANLLLLHHSLDGAKTGPHEWVMPSRLRANHLPRFDLIVSGHYHQHQIVKDSDNYVIYAGAPLQHDAGERDYKPGFLVVGDDGSIRHIENFASPRFVVIEAETEEDLESEEVRDNDYLIVKWKGEEKDGKKLRDQLKGLGIGIVNVTPDSARKAIRTNISTADAVETMLAKYAEARLGAPDPLYLDEGVKLYHNSTP